MSKKFQWIFIGVSFCLLFFNFWTNFLHSADPSRFQGFMPDENARVFGRLIHSQRAGFFADGGFTGRIKQLDDGTERVKSKSRFIEFAVYKDDIDIRYRFTPYLSYSGGSGLFFSLIDNLLPFSNRMKYSVIQAILAALNALVFTFLIIWIMKYFQFIPSLLFLITTLFSVWLTLYGLQFEKMLWTTYLPLVISFFIYPKSEFESLRFKSYLPYYAVVSIMVFLKCFFSSFDYVTAVLVMAVLPLIFYEIYLSSSIFKSVQRFIFASFAAVSGLLISLIVQIVQIGFYKGGLNYGIDHVGLAFFRRSSSTLLASKEIRNLASIQAFEAGYFETLKKYFLAEIFNLKNIFHFIPGISELNKTFLYYINFTELTIIFIVCSFIIIYVLNVKKNYLFEKDYRKYSALIIITWISLVGPLSWLIIFKPLVYIHTFFMKVVLHMPFLLFGFILTGVTIQLLTQKKQSLM
jgi:hypothetical protein